MIIDTKEEEIEKLKERLKIINEQYNKLLKDITQLKTKLKLSYRRRDRERYFTQISQIEAKLNKLKDEQEDVLRQQKLLEGKRGETNGK